MSEIEVLSATGNVLKARHCTFLEVCGGEGNLSDDEVHLLMRSSDGKFAQSWFNAGALVEAIERARSWGGTDE